MAEVAQQQHGGRQGRDVVEAVLRVVADRLPTTKTRTCWIRAPPSYPNGFPITFTAVFISVLNSWSSGIYVISLHGSNMLYFELLLRIFWAAPTPPARRKGMAPQHACHQDKGQGKTSEGVQHEAGDLDHERGEQSSLSPSTLGEDLASGDGTADSVADSVAAEWHQVGKE